MESDGDALAELLILIQDYHDFNPSKPRLNTRLPTALQFCKQVSRGLPCLYPVLDFIQNYRASRWTKEDLITAIPEKVEVAVTPNGRADSLCSVPGHGDEKVFLQPANIDMTLQELFERLDAPTAESSAVHYLQSQNGNLASTALAPLLEDLPRNFPFAHDVLGDPEAVNIWIGDERSVTSAHRDPYENLYMVLRGSKVFTVWSPVDEITLDSMSFLKRASAQMFRTGRFVFDTASSTFSSVLDEGSDDSATCPPQIPWVTVDPSLHRENLNAKHLLYKHARPQTVVVRAGQMLYLPSGWFHHVAQECGTWDDGSKAPCISINYWYDQDYEGEKYVMRQLISRLTQQAQRRAIDAL